ncbi:hypothetical protein D3C87_08010 [compost metagenome]
MKTVTITIAFTSLLVSLSACKKDYSCYCANGFGAEPVVEGVYSPTSKKKAKSNCEAKSNSDRNCYAVFSK